MLKKTIKFHDLDGNPVEETFYFNLTKMELADASMGTDGGLAEYLTKIVASQDQAKILTEFKKIILMCVGQRSEDGKRFVKTPAITAEFAQTEAFGELYFEMMSDENAAIEFIRGVIPKDLASKVESPAKPAVVQKYLLGDGVQPETAPAVIDGETLMNAASDITKYTKQELLEMPQELFDELVGKDPKKMSNALLSIAFQRRASRR